MKAIKQITTIFMLILGLLVINSAALASDTAFDNVKIDGTAMTATNTVYVERDSSIEVDVWYTATTDHDNVKIKTWIGGYEYDDVEDVTNMFDAEAGVTYHKVLTLELPDDMDASKDYTVYVQLYNSNSVYIDEDYDLRVQEKRHRLDISDLMLRPSTVTAGSSLFATVRVENMGDRKEENIKVTVSIPDLGVSARTWIDELEWEEADDGDGEPEKAETSEEMKLTIPQDATEGDYTIEVSVSYNRGHESVQATETIHVKASKEETTEEAPKTLISVDGTSKDIVAGVETVFKIMVANLGEETSVYSVDVTGTDVWSTTRVEPAMITLTPESTGEMYLYIKPKTESEAAGKHSFTFKVKAGNTIVAEKTLAADVTGTTDDSTTTTTTNGQTNFASLKNALVIGFGVLVVLLVILGLIIAFNKMNKDEDEEIPTSEGQAYY